MHSSNITYPHFFRFRNRAPIRKNIVTVLMYIILVVRVARSMIGYWHHSVVCLSVRLSVMLSIVAKRYILQQKCLNKWIGSALLGKRRHNFQLTIPTLGPQNSPRPKFPTQYDRLSYQQMGFLYRIITGWDRRLETKQGIEWKNC